MAKRSYLMITIVIITGIAVLFYSTDQFQAFTAEQARRVKIVKKAPKLLDVAIQDSNAEFSSLSDYKGKYMIATFVYTSCGDVCPVVEMNLKEIYSSLPNHLLEDKIQLLSISFDPKRDTPGHLEHYRELFQADGDAWKMVRIPNQQELDALLEQTGVIVIPTEQGFEHNAAFYLIDPNGRLIQIFDYNAPGQVVEELKKLLSF